MIVGHIGARKGSKGVPGKNFRALNGKPLIDWSLDQLLGSPRIDVVIVSTDDEDIYHHARSKQTLDIGMRPPELCTDTASKWMVWQHALCGGNSCRVGHKIKRDILRIPGQAAAAF